MPQKIETHPAYARGRLAAAAHSKEAKPSKANKLPSSSEFFRVVPSRRLDTKHQVDA